MAETKIVADRISTTIEFDFSELGLGDGTVSLPSLAFSSDQDTGIYRIGANNFGFSTNGINRLDIDTSRVNSTLNMQAPRVLAADGTAANPSFGGTSHNSGLAINAAGNLLFVVNSTTSIFTRSDVFGPNADATMDIGEAGAGFKHIYMNDGTNALPAFSFNGQTNTGFYRPALNTLGLSVGGTEQWRFTNAGAIVPINSNGIIYINDGSVSAPSISFNLDTDTGIFRVGSNDFALVANGVKQLELDSFKIYPNVPIHTTISGTAGTPAFGWQNDTSQNTGFYRAAEDTIGITCGGISEFEIYNDHVAITQGGGSGTALTQMSLQFGSGTPAYRHNIKTHHSTTANLNRVEFWSATALSSELKVMEYNGAGGVGIGASPVTNFNLAVQTVTGQYAMKIIGPGAEFMQIGAGDPEISASGGQFYIRTLTAHPIVFFTSTNTSNFNALTLTSGGQAQFLDGSAAAPSISFNADSDTGIYRDTTNSLVIAAGGSKTMVFNNTPQLLSAGNGTTGNPIYSFANRSDTGMYYLGSTAGEVGFSSAGNVSYRMHPNVHSWYIGGVEKINISSSGFFVPVTDNVLKLGQSGLRWSEVWAANGSIQTSHSSTKMNIQELDWEALEVPAGVTYDRDGRRWLGYLNDSLPNEGRPVDEDGNVCPKDNYEQAVIGVLCAVVKGLKDEVKALKAKLGV